MQTPPQAPTLWDYIKNNIAPVSKSPVSQVAQSLTSNLLDNPLGYVIKKSAGAIGKKALGLFDSLAEIEGETLKGNALRQNVSEIILPNTIGGYTATKAERQKASEKISLGRAMLVRTDTILEKIFGKNINTGLSPKSYDPKTGKMYNVYEDSKREEYMGGIGFFGNLATGGADLLWGSILSPFTGLGGLGRIGKATGLEKTITTERVIDKKDLATLERAEADQLQYLDVKNKLNELDNENVNVSGRTLEEIEVDKKALELELPKLEIKANTATDNLSKIGYAKGFDEFIRQAVVLNAEQLLKHRVIKESAHPELLAGLLGETDNIYEAAKIVRAAAGDINAQRLLAAESTSTWMAMQRARQPLGELETKIKAYKQTDGDLHELGLLQENATILRAELDDLIKKDSKLQRAVQAADEKVLEGRIGTSVFSSIETYRAKKAEVFGEASTVKSWDVEYFQRNPFVATVAVATWPFRERPAGYVRTKGMNTSDSVKELVSFMQSVSGWTGAKGATIRAEYIRKYTEAPNEITRERIVKDMYEQAISETGKKYGLTERQIKEIKDKHDQALASAIKHYNQKGYLIDENDTLVKIPQLSSQLAESIPLPDIKKLDSLLKNTENAWRRSASEINSMVVKPLDLIDELWRPAVLFRLGYLQRNVGEGWGRKVAALGASTALKMFPDLLTVSVKGKNISVDGALKRFYQNRGAGLQNTIDMRRAAVQAKSDVKFSNDLSEFRSMPPLRVSWNRIIELQEDAIVLNTVKIKELKDLLRGTPKKNIVQRTSIIDELTIRKEFEKQAIAKLNNFAKQADKKGIKGNRYSVGQGYISYGGYDDLPLTFQNDAGEVLKQLTSSASTKTIELKSSSRVYGALDSNRYTVDNYKELLPTDKDYFMSLARIVNKQFRNSETIIRLMRGDSIESVVAFLRTQKGLKELQAARYTDPEEYVLKMQFAVERYIPDSALRVRLSKEQVSAAELKTILGRREDLRSIHGESIKEIPDLNGYEKYQLAVRSAFRYIGSLPEDALVRHPFADAIYQKALKESIDNANRQGIKLTDNEITGIVTGARRKALVETRRVMYTIERVSNAAHLFRFLEPFFMAAQNTAQVWSKLVYNDPRLLGLAGYIYGSPERAGLMQTDPLTDREIVVMQIPNWMRKGFFKKALEGQESISFEKGAANLILQGQDWWRLGDGIFTGITASEILKAYPEAEWSPILEYVLPYGPSRVPGSIDILAPGLLKRTISRLREVDDRNYNSNLAIATRVEDFKYNQGLRDEPTPLEIKERVDAFNFLQILTSAILPVSIKFRPEFQFYIDKARQYREKYGTDADVRYYQDFPDYFDFFFSISKNPSGMEPTKDAIRYKKKYQNLVDEVGKDYPEFLQLITNSYGAPTEFDRTAYTWQFLNQLRTGEKDKIRETKSAEEISRDNDSQRGWIEYGAFKKELNAVLALRMKNDPSVTSLQSKNAEDLANAKKQYVATQQTENTVWWREYNEGAGSKRPYFFLKAVKTILNDKKFMADRGQEPLWDAFNQYIILRKEYEQVLKIRGSRAGGSSSLQAKSNKQLFETWMATVEKIKTIDQSGAFSSFYDRFLDNDTLEEIK